VAKAKARKKKPKKVPPVFARLRKHFGTDPAKLPVIEQKFQLYQLANLHLTIEELLAAVEGRALVGMVAKYDYMGPSLAKFSSAQTAEDYQEGPVEYADVQLAGDQKLACVKRGLYTFREAGKPLALLVAEGERYANQGLTVDVMAPERDAAERFARKLAKGVTYGTAFRGKVLSVEEDCHGQTSVVFHKLPTVSRDALILPEDLLRRIERQAMGLTKHASTLKAAGRHLKRGILMHGKPGTGKTLSAMYLAAQMPGRTVLVLSGRGIGSIGAACALARLLEPATVVLEDVDLIGTERSGQTVGANSLLFELLNQMDGLGEDADILFVLTTNRPEFLEPALAARPGRIDLAIEVPLPDEACRERLFELYGRGLKLELADRAVWVKRTKGVSAAFVRELLRKAAVLAAEDGAPAAGALVVTDKHVEEALAELLVAGGPLTRALLGFAAANGE
jgi:cell division protease FtsH